MRLPSFCWPKTRQQPRPTPNKSAYGIKTLYDSANAVVDIVFVHGLTGHREKTWTAKGAEKSWPEVLLKAQLPQSRILTFGYDANVVDWRALVSKNRVDNHAQNLLAALAHWRDDDKSIGRPIIFVAHSLGGLVCEDALLWAQNNAEKHLEQIFKCTRGILFLGTPHSGSGFAVAAETLATCIGLLKQTNARILKVLQTNSEVLTRIQAGFLSMIRARANDPDLSIAITCFYEELPLIGVGKVVPMYSAILPAYAKIGIYSNHMNMTKFEDEDDPGFISVSGELRRWVKELRTVHVGQMAISSMRQGHHAEDRSQNPGNRNSPMVTHNGNNMGEARVVYGGNMTNIASAVSDPTSSVS